MRTILSVIGTRPEAIKMAPVITELRRFPDEIKVVVCITSQHRQLVDPIMQLFNIIPDYDFDLMRSNQTLTQITTTVLSKMGGLLSQLQPDWVLAQGDTTTVMATALACYYQRAPFGHIEAGLRTGDKFNPYPEEMNRILADQLADLHFAPTDQARLNLLAEGMSKDTIHITGNTVIDALLQIAKSNQTTAIETELSTIPLWTDRIVLITVHRRESFGEGMQNICQAIATLAENYPDIQFVYPVHPNPNVTTVAQQHLQNIPNISLIKPLGYASLIHLMKRAYLIMTDSGGIQEEAPTLGKPIVVLRQTTERPEGIAAGTARLVGTSAQDIIETTSQILDDPTVYHQMAQAINPYGDGQASERIVNILLNSQVQKR